MPRLVLRIMMQKGNHVDAASGKVECKFFLCVTLAKWGNLASQVIENYSGWQVPFVLECVNRQLLICDLFHLMVMFVGWLVGAAVGILNCLRHLIHRTSSIPIGRRRH